MKRLFLILLIVYFSFCGVESDDCDDYLVSFFLSDLEDYIFKFIQQNWQC